MNPKRFILSSTLLLLLTSLTAFGQANMIGYVNGTTCVALKTNTTGGNGTWGWPLDGHAVWQISVVSTNAAGTNLMAFHFDTSVNGTDWSENAYNLAVTPTGTTTATSIQRLTNTIGGMWMRVGDIHNSNTVAVVISRLHCYSP